MVRSNPKAIPITAIFLVPRGGLKRAVPAISVDTLRVRAKETHGPNIF